MIIYSILYPILTFLFIMIWVTNTTINIFLIRLLPIIMSYVLIGIFVIEFILVLIFRKKLKSVKNKRIALIFAFLFYEIVMWITMGDLPIINIFNEPFLKNILAAVSVSSFLSLAIIFCIICIKDKMKKRSFV
ncbi:hypothetical protein [Aureivirga marina]|uniref:hypothetical protein n=1 Tax=Aureivirga marina TaxID=1182451 RepID=UPI0018CAC3FE|nr:hypothetical protein [Aureivirga marina]